MNFRSRCSMLFLLLWAVSLVTPLQAQLLEPIQWHVTKQADASLQEVAFTADIDLGWHLYGSDLPEGGPISTTFTFEKLEGVKLVGEVISPKEGAIREFSEMFNLDLTWYEGSATFVQKVKVTNPQKFALEGYITYMGCDNSSCLPPTTYEFALNYTSPALLNAANSSSSKKTSASPVQSMKPLNTENVAVPSFTASDWWSPVTDQLKNLQGEDSADDSSLWVILLSGFLGGLLALLTPCVWPMIPMTVSFFLKRTKSRKRSIADALLYGLSIVLIYLLLGLVITLLFGASALNSLATNAVFNMLFFSILVLFAFSFLGAFEITLPAAWSTRMDSKADATTGILSIFFMAFTLVLVSFSCTGPIIGTLLVQAATMGSLVGPAIGMAGFALALAIPFALFAIFPSWLQGMPKSGGWLNSVKVVLGFLELALALKFLSVADLAYGWGILDREVFLVLWIVLFALMGYYLLGKLKLSHDSDLKHVTLPRLLLAIVSFSFALYMVPGLWGAPLKAISAFAPPLETQDFNLYNEPLHRHFEDYDAGMAYAQKEGLPVLVDFSGYGCVNCRKMEATVWSDAEVKAILENDYVVITLMVDDKTPLAEPISVEEFGKTTKLRTVGDRWSYLQRHKFGANAQPYYTLLNNKGDLLAEPRAYNEDIAAYIAFLQEGIATYKKEK